MVVDNKDYEAHIQAFKDKGFKTWERGGIITLVSMLIRVSLSAMRRSVLHPATLRRPARQLI